ncbi:MAG: type II toxin-antitoxin system HipA family toxin [Gammaproteobacteria bacterium]|nr:MAG: type II toxin-antitoxin system HipA family toxin [Gammaproteobacteria bacterium]
MATVAEVRLWGRTIGAVSLEDGARAAAFQYEPAFVSSRIELSPLVMPLSVGVYQFPSLPEVSFRGLPGMLADSLPDRFGHALIDAWLATGGRRPESFNAVERLCYIGVRGMGALEYAPAIGPPLRASTKVSLDALVALASEVLTHRNSLEVSFAPGRRPEGLTEILRVGTSAAGARAKAIIAWNRETNQVRSGQVKAPPGFSYWLLKFDGVSANKDKELEDPQGYTVIEYAYSLMARDAGIEMTECRLLEEGGRRHFMTRRFDRESDGGKLHMQSLAALAHFDFNSAGVYGYEQAFDVMKRLALPMRSIEQQFRRMLFNVVARNQDDHVKNIAFLMDKSGAWSLSAAFDVTYAYNPAGLWTARHQMTINGKTDGFELADFRSCAQLAGLKRGREEELLAEVVAAVQEWPRYAHRAGVLAPQREQIGRTLRLHLGTGRRRAKSAGGSSSGA